jgi:hypothetical protein
MKKFIYILFIGFVLTLIACKDSNDTRPISGATPDFSTSNDIGGGKVGVGGSMARFTIKDNYLYTLVGNILIVYDITNPSEVIEKRSMNLAENRWGTNIETIFPYKNNLLFGTNTGMLIYDLSNPELPAYSGEFAHVMACDPVVAENDIAYVTLRGGTPCRGSINQLDILDISNLRNPNLIESYEMISPLGLGIDNNTLFVCDGDFLKVFNVENPNNIVPIKDFSVKNPFDVIPLSYKKELILSAKGGIMQFDYSDIENIKLLSILVVTN